MSLATPIQALSLSLLLGCSRNLPAGDPNQPDVLLISIDSLRRDHLSAYGHDLPTTPAIDKLAAAGAKFTAATSASPWTLPAHVTMLSGQWPTAHGVIEDDRRIPADLPWLPSALQAAGWRTLGLTTTIYVSRKFGFDRGFERFDDHEISRAQNLHHSVRAAQVVDEAIAWGKTLDARPAFVFLHLYDVHYPYAPPPGYETRFNRAADAEDLHYRMYEYYLKNPLKPGRLKLLQGQYDECLLAVDDQIARLLAAWDRPAQVIITADHGEEFGERGAWGHAHTLHPEALDIPLILSGPAFSPSVRAEPVGHIDLAPTVAALAGLPWSGPGVDLRPPVPDRVLLAETSRFKTAKLSILSGGLRFEADAATGDHLFDQRIDPAERQDRADSRPSEAAALSTQLFTALGDPCTLPEGASLAEQGILWQSGARLSEIQGPARFGLYPPDDAHCPTAPPLDLDGDTRARLEALGYVQPEGAPEAEKPEGAAVPGLDAGQGSVKEEAPGR